MECDIDLFFISAFKFQSSNVFDNGKGKTINIRRSEVRSYLGQGMTRQDISKELKVDASTISSDIGHLTLKSQQYIDDMVKTLPFMDQKSIDG